MILCKRGKHMARKAKDTRYTRIDSMNDPTCALCGTDGGLLFKEATVCEDCLIYVKSLD